MSTQGAQPTDNPTLRRSHRHHHHAQNKGKDEAKAADSTQTAKKEHHHHHHHHHQSEGYGQRQKSTALKVKPRQTQALESAPELSETLTSRAVSVVDALNTEQLGIQDSAVIEQIKKDSHADIAQKIFAHANENTLILSGQGKDTKHLEGALLPEHHGMILDETTKQWRIRTTDEQIAFEKAQKKEAKKAARAAI